MFKTQLLETLVVLQASNIVALMSIHSMTTSDTLCPSISALTVQVAVNPSADVVVSDSGEVSTTRNGPVVVQERYLLLCEKTKRLTGARKLTSNCNRLKWFAG